MDIRIDNLAKRYEGGFELRIPSLYIRDGETLGLVGNNGAGKTTFLRLMLDLLPADEGTIQLGPHSVDDTLAWKSKTAVFLDQSFLIDFLTPDEFLAFVGTTYGISKTDQQAYLERFLEFFSDPVFNQTTRRIRDLSTGNVKKVGIIAALIVRPELLVLDEPFANLDPRSQMQLKRYLAEENEARNTTLLISSHDLVHVTDVCERITVLDEGQIVRDEPTTPETLASLESFFSADTPSSLSKQTG